MLVLPNAEIFMNFPIQNKTKTSIQQPLFFLGTSLH